MFLTNKYKTLTIIINYQNWIIKHIIIYQSYSIEKNDIKEDILQLRQI